MEAARPPEEGGALILLEALLSDAGFACTRVDRGGVSNLFARWGDRGHARTFGFNGHTDVVPIGDRAAWTQDPFGGALIDGKIYGRGACDMKGGLAASIIAVEAFVEAFPDFHGAIEISGTADEESGGYGGVAYLAEKGYFSRQSSTRHHPQTPEQRPRVPWPSRWLMG